MSMIAQVLPRAVDAAPPANASSPTALVDTELGPIRLHLYRDFAPLRDRWLQLEQNAVCTHGQTYAWSEAWYRLVEQPRGAKAALLMGAHGDRPLFLWPFEVAAVAGVRALRWMGEKHTNYNLGLYDADFMARVGAGDVRALLRAAAHLAGGIPLICLRNQPLAWDGIDNPLARLPHQASPSAGHVVTLQRDFAALYRGNFGKRSRDALKRKQRKLEAIGPVEYGRADSLGERLDLMEAFFRQKSAWFAQNGIEDAFADPRHRAFYRAMAALERTEVGHLQLSHLRVGGEIAAIFVGIAFRDRFHVVSSSIGGNEECRRWSPGLLLMRHQIEQMCGGGFSHYDLGVGEARHKAEWADREVPLFDTFLGLRPPGWLIVPLLAANARAKRTVKSRPGLWSMARRLRRALRRRSV